MKSIGIVFGSSTGTCEEIANKIADKLSVDSSNVIDVSSLTADDCAKFDMLLLGSSTWGDGELQDDWYDGIDTLKSADLSDKIVGFFGCGDADSYPDTFCDAMKLIHEAIENSGCTFIGEVTIDDYSFSSSASVVDGKFIGLALDDINESEKTDARISNWVEIIKTNL